MRRLTPSRRAGLLPKRLVSLELVAPSIDGDAAVRAVVRELERDFPWATKEGWTIEFWGLRRTRSGVAESGCFRVRGPWVPLGRVATPVRAILAWATHFSLTLTRPRAGILVAAAPWAGTGAVAALCLRRRRRRLPLVVRVQGRTASKALLVHRSRIRFRLIEALERFVLRRADLVVPMGPYTVQRARRLGVPGERLVVLPFPPAWREARVELAPAGRRQGHLIVCGARLVREKGVDVLLHALPEVLDHCPDARLCIAGDGPRRPELERLAERLSIASSVRFTGWLTPAEMWALFRSAGIAVLPSRWEEGLGMVLVEAALAGCALVATDLGGMRDVVRSGETGLLVPPEDADALAAALIRCLTRTDERARFASSARAVAAGYIEQRDAALREFSQRVTAMRSP